MVWSSAGVLSGSSGRACPCCLADRLTDPGTVLLLERGRVHRLMAGSGRLLPATETARGRSCDCVTARPTAVAQSNARAGVLRRGIRGVRGPRELRRRSHRRSDVQLSFSHCVLSAAMRCGQLHVGQHALTGECPAPAGAGPHMSPPWLVCCSWKLARGSGGPPAAPGGSGALPGAEPTREGPIEGAS